MFYILSQILIKALALLGVVYLTIEGHPICGLLLLIFCVAGPIFKKE